MGDKKGTIVRKKDTIVSKKGIIVCKRVCAWVDTICGGAYEEEKNLYYLQYLQEYQ